MDLDPETLPLWYDMIGALKSHIKYSHSVKETESHINVTDIFCHIDEKAVQFWGQLLADRSLKSNMETLLGCSFKKGGSKVKVQQIPLSRKTEISQGFIDLVANRIRSTERLWTCTAVKGLNETLLSPEVSRMEIIDVPITPAPTSNEVAKVMEQHSSDTRRSYHRRQMKPGNVYDMSASSQRRIMKQVEETIIGKFNCDQTEAQQIAQMYSARSSLNVSTPSFINRKSTNENPASNSSTRESSPSRLMIASVEKNQRKYLGLSCEWSIESTYSS